MFLSIKLIVLVLDFADVLHSLNAAKNAVASGQDETTGAVFGFFTDSGGSGKHDKIWAAILNNSFLISRSVCSLLLVLLLLLLLTL